MKLAWTLRRLLPVLLVLDVSAAYCAEDTIKVGILHSLSGTMAISESALKDTVLMLVADQNRKGGLLGRKLEPVSVDPASDWNAFTDKAFELLAREKAAVVFGCWTSTSRKAVIPVFERLNGLLFYPVQYEGEESSRKCFLHRRCAKPAGHSGRSLSDEQGRWRDSPLGSAWNRLCLPAHDQPDPERVS
jgi:urea transport system substrate-binding protein